MAIYHYNELPLIAQTKTGVCWMASAQMVHKWSRATGRGKMIDPMSHAGSKWRWGENLDWGAYDNGKLAEYFKMNAHDDLTLNYSGVEQFLKKHGPIWTGLQKNWGGNNHGHVVVIRGVADTGVLIHDHECGSSIPDGGLSGRPAASYQGPSIYTGVLFCN
jgi:hypothetical protein